MQDFGLCDLKGAYQHTSRMRGKGFLAIAFLELGCSGNAEIVKVLSDWTTISPKVAAAIVMTGEREAVEEFGAENETGVPILWDPDSYIFPLWAVSVVPTVFIVNDKGVVLGRVRGADESELNAAKGLLAEEVRRSDEAAAAAAAAKAAADAAKK